MDGHFVARDHYSQKQQGNLNQLYHANSSYIADTPPELQGRQMISSRGGQNYNQRSPQSPTPNVNNSANRASELKSGAHNNHAALHGNYNVYNDSTRSHDDYSISNRAEFFPQFSGKNESSKAYPVNYYNQKQEDKKMDSVKIPQYSMQPPTSPHSHNANLNSQTMKPFPLCMDNGQNFKSTLEKEPNSTIPKGSKDDFTLSGLIQILKRQNASMDPLYSGIDLTNLGLNLQSSEPLITTFSSPFHKESIRKEPEFSIPPCYLTPYRMPLDKIKLFGDETLLYIFYTHPKDIMQVWAARILLSREWRYNKEQQIWYHKAKESGPLITTPTYEKGSYIYMDVLTWKEVRVDDKVLEYVKIEVLNKNTEKTDNKIQGDL